MGFNKITCYKTLNERYDSVELKTLIFLNFPRVHLKLSDEMRRDAIILLLLENCENHEEDGEALEQLLGEGGISFEPAKSLLEKAEPWNLDFTRQIDACIEPAVFSRRGQLVGLALRCEEQRVLDSFYERLLRELYTWLEPDSLVGHGCLTILPIKKTLDQAIQDVREIILSDAQFGSVLFRTNEADTPYILKFWQSLRASLTDGDLPYPMFVLLPVEPEYCQACPTALANLGLADLGEPALAFNDVNLWIQDVAGSCHFSDPLKNRWKRHFWEQCGRGDLRRAYLYLDRVKTILMKDPSPANIQRQLGL